MPASLLRPEDIGPTDAERILLFLNTAADAEALAETVGFSDGIAAGRRVASELIAARPLLTLDAIQAVTGVGALRFTEIVTALSGARPPFAPDVLHFLPVDAMPWLGRTIPVTVQLTDADGLGVTNRMITCLASDGIVSARAGLQMQSGSAIRIAPEPGGIVRFSYGPRLWPQLDDAAKSALSAELARLDPSADTPQKASRQIDTLAMRYRGQGAGALQSAIDGLFNVFDAPVTAPLAPWPVQPITLLALTHDDGGSILQAASVTLEIRNWLGAFLAALRRQIEADQSLPEALKHLLPEAERGADLSRKILQATQGFSALERGVLGRQLRDATTGRTVTGFLNDAAVTLKGDAIVNTVRAAGASEAAISSGGFAVFEAIRTVQEAGDSIKPPSKGGFSLDDFRVLDTRLSTLESSAITKGELDRFRTSFTATIDQRFETFKADSLTKSDLDGLRRTLTSEFDGKLEAFDDSRTLDERFSSLESRLKGVESTAATKSDLASLRTALTRDLDGLRTSITADFDAKIKAIDTRVTTDPRFSTIDARLAEVETNRISQADLAKLGTELTASFDRKLATTQQDTVTKADLQSLRKEINEDVASRTKDLATRSELDTRFTTLETDVAGQLRTKANASTVGQLQTALTKVTDEQTTLRTDLTKISTTSPNLRIDPTRR